LEDGVHEGLEGSGSVAEAEGHDCRFEEALFAFEGGFPFVALFDADVVVSPADVEFGVIARALEFVNEVRDQRERSGVFYGDVVQGTVVLDGAEAFALFCYEKKGAGVGRF
jgi:hypothetical protein